MQARWGGASAKEGGEHQLTAAREWDTEAGEHVAAEERPEGDEGAVGAPLVEVTMILVSKYRMGVHKIKQL